MSQLLATARQKAVLVVMCYARTVDLHNLHALLPLLPPTTQVMVCAAIGLLTPCTRLTAPDLHYKLRMDRPDEREMARRWVWGLEFRTGGFRVWGLGSRVGYALQAEDGSPGGEGDGLRVVNE
jgi:hypothetical protein